MLRRSGTSQEQKKTKKSHKIQAVAWIDALLTCSWKRRAAGVLCWLGVLWFLTLPVLARPPLAPANGGALDPIVLALKAALTGNFAESHRALVLASQKTALEDTRNLYAPALECLVYDAQGLYRRSIPRAEELSQHNRKREFQVPLKLLLVQLGRHSGRGDLVATHLPGLLGLVRTLPCGPLTRFVCATLSVETEIPGWDPETLLARHDQVWKEWTQPENWPSDLLFPSRWTSEAVSIWLFRLQRWRDRLGPDHPLTRKIEERIARDLENLKGSAIVMSLGQNPELLLQSYLLSVDLAGQAVENGDLEKGETLERELSELRDRYAPEIDRQYFKPTAEAFAQAGIPFDSKAGDLSRARSAHHRLKARIYLARNRAEALQELQQSHSQLQMAPDLRGEVDHYQLSAQAFLRLKTPGWVDKALQQTAQLKQLGARTGSRTARAYGLGLEGLALAGGGRPATATLEAAALELESLVTETGRLRPEDSFRLVSLASEVYDRLLQDCAQQRDSVKALSWLSRRQQFQTLVNLFDVRQPQQKTLRSLSEAQQKLAGLQLESESQKSLPAQQRDPNVGQLLARTRAEFYQVLRDTRAKDPAYGAALSIDPVNYVSVQKRLGNDTLLLQPYQSHDHLLLLVVTHKDFVMVQVPVSSTTLHSLILSARKNLQVPPPGAGGGPDTKLIKDLQELRKILIEPIDGLLAGKTRLIFVPSGDLHYLPLQALQSRAGEYLIEQLEVEYLTKVTDLQTPPRQPSGREIVIVGNPDGTLPGAEQEAREIGKLFKTPSLLLADQATQKALEENSNSRYVHLATHGILTGHDLQSSYLVLFGASEQGKLRANEILQLDLDHTELVTLSCCQTGLGEGRPGAQVTSLAEAFSLAGCATVVATLWSIDDQATRTLMTQFYQALQAGTPKGLALRSSQLKLLRDPKTRHPFFWAPFVLLGQGE